LDSICPTGAGKVAGVKIEIDKEKGAGGVEATARFGPWSAAMNGISREKTRMAQKQGNFFAAGGRDYTVIPEFSSCCFAGQRLGRGNDWPRKTTKSLRIGEVCFRPFEANLVIDGWLGMC
jgi:hypothetical protein